MAPRATWLRCLGPGCGIKRGVAAFGLALAVAGGIAIADGKPDPSRHGVQAITVTARPITSFERIAADRHRYGKLEWRGGLVLASDAKSFGGWSGLALSARGDALVAVSDAGAWMTARVERTGDRLAGLSNVRLGPIKALGAKTLRRGRDRDAEALQLVEGDIGKGRVLIAFEQNHRIGWFDITPEGVSPPRSYVALPADARRMPAMKGLEAVAMLRGGPRKGTLVAIAERFTDRAGNHRGWLIGGGGAEGFTVTDIGGFDITDVAALPDGSLLILERRFRWLEGVRMRIRYVKAGAIRPGAGITGEVLLEADMSHEIDNMEALAVHTSARGETMLTLMSDDNFNGFLQRTVMLQFAIPTEELASLSR